MNYKQKEFANRRLLQTLRFTSRSGNKEGYIKIWASNSWAHERTKAKICYYLKKYGWKIYTETEFINKSRADIVGIRDGKGIIIEVLNSETPKELNEKIKKYPSEFELIALHVKDNIHKLIDLL